jgi:hypothetical protein
MELHRTCQTSIDARRARPTEVKTSSRVEIITADAAALAKQMQLHSKASRTSIISQVVESVALLGDSDKDVHYRNDSLESAGKDCQYGTDEPSTDWQQYGGRENIQSRLRRKEGKRFWAAAIYSPTTSMGPGPGAGETIFPGAVAP